MSMPMNRRPDLQAATLVVPAPLKGSRTISPLYEKSFTRRAGTSSGNMAGCPYSFILVSGGIVHRPFTHSLNSSGVISIESLFPAFLWVSLSNTSINSQVYFRYGIEGEHQLPQAVYFAL